jgi:LuxR family maltose regulon positive regulatory protein
MASPLVRTKLYVPRLRRNLVARVRLSERLDAGADAKLVVVSAPAGFGKTTAVAAWLEKAPGQNLVAWLSLEESDRESSPFWTYVMTALQAAFPGVGEGVPEALQLAHQPIEPVLASVLNEFADLDRELFLVLDDYHVVDGPAIAEGMVFLLEHLPPRVHVVLITRADPALPMARLRTRGELVEIRAADLRFTPEEVSTYFNQTGGPELDESEVAALASRTEGWVAALQLAALSLQDRPDRARFIAGFSGDNRYIVDYLVEEVLARQPDEVRDFLLHTSILDRLTGELCDSVTGQSGGKAMLETVSRANLFLVSLDDTRTWYRYHHLFADMLQTRLHEERADLLSELHGRASRWYEQAGEPVPAVRHAVAAGDLDRAADLMEPALPRMLRERQEATIRGWMDHIPAAMIRARPVLCIGFIGSLISSGEFAAAPALLRDLADSVDPASDAGERTSGLQMVVVDDAELERLAGLVELYWAALALVDGDLVGTHRHAKEAVDRAAPDDDLTRAGAWVLSGLAYWGVGELDAAGRAYSAGMDGLLRAGNISDFLGSSIAVADIRVAQGHLGQAMATFEHGLQLAARESGVLRGTPDMYVGMSQILLERDDVPAALQLVGRSQELGEHLGLPQNAYRWRRVLALVSARQGNLQRALELVDQAQAVHFGDFSPNVEPLPALRARLEATRGNIDGALAWAREQRITFEDELSYLREYEHITLARILLAQFHADRGQLALGAATTLLERLRVAAEQGGRNGSLIEILVLQSLVLQHARAGRSDMHEPLKRALTLAEPEGYVRVFAAEGPAIRTLLQQMAKEQPASPYLRRLIDACVIESAARAGVGLGGQANVQRLLDPLSERELEVLRLLGTDMDGPGLARYLSVSLNTLRTHTKNIYAKLGVGSRRAAIRRAAELKLFLGNRDS